MAKFNQPKGKGFEEFRDQSNAMAPYAAFSRSLGIPDDDKTPDIREAVEQKIHRVLAENGLSELSLGGLAALLSKELRPLTRQHQRDLSMLDQVTTGLTDDAKIQRFLGVHGADVDDPEDFAYLQGMFREAIDFYDNVIVSGTTKSKIHPDLRRINNPAGIYNIFKTAAGHERKMLVPQACGLLRIADVVDFMNRDPFIAMIPQIKDAFDKLKARHVVRSNGNGGKKVYYRSGRDGDDLIELVRFDSRIKERMRIIAKLLHKPHTATAEVIDHFGFRWTTKSAADTLKLIYLQYFDPETAIFPAMNIRIGKTKQRMFEAEMLKTAFRDPEKAPNLFAMLAQETINHEDIDVESLGQDDGALYSSKLYRAIHVIGDVPIVLESGERRMFPVENQYLDVGAMILRDKNAPHPSYVADQMETVNKRVVGNNLLTAFRSLWDGR
jgi:uncharacterized protein (TIGR04562 family)